MMLGILFLLLEKIGSLVSKEDFVEPYPDERVATSWARAGRWQRNTMADSLDGALS
jgi:hypothetical protein